MLCPLCKRKLHGTLNEMASHIEACHIIPTDRCPRCHGGLSRVRVTEVECLSAECGFSLKVIDGGNSASPPPLQ